MPRRRELQRDADSNFRGNSMTVAGIRGQECVALHPVYEFVAVRTVADWRIYRNVEHLALLINAKGDLDRLAAQVARPTCGRDDDALELGREIVSTAAARARVIAGAGADARTRSAAA